MATYTQAIWKDAVVVLAPDETDVEYRIQVKKGLTWETIYTGRAYARPNRTDPTIRINDICADYLTRSFNGDDDHYDATFKVEYYDAAMDDWYERDTYTFTRDWSYDRSFVSGTDFPLAPVTTRLNPAQYLPLFSFNGVFHAEIIGGDFNEDFNEDFSSLSEYINNISDGVTYWLDLSQYEGWTIIEANGRIYTPADLCGGYALYYINAYGGWDTLPIAGRTIKTDAMTRYNREAEYNNADASARGADTYANEITRKYRLNTGALTTEQARQMHHLLGSTFVYLHDIERGEILPVVLTNNSHEHKDRVGSLHLYEIEATLAQDRTRR